MSLAKAVISGIAVRDAEVRSTSNDLDILSFTMNINEADESLLRVIMYGERAKNIAGLIKKGSKVVVEGRLQTNTVKGNNGEDKKIIELQAQNLDVMGSADISSNSSSSVDYDMPDEAPDELIGDDEIPF